MNYRLKPNNVEAFKLAKDITIDCGGKRFSGQKGDYLIFSQHGDICIMSEKDFHEKYELNSVNFGGLRINPQDYINPYKTYSSHSIYEPRTGAPQVKQLEDINFNGPIC